MKARNVRYVRPASLADAYRILDIGNGEAVPLAGGQSLLAGLNMRLSAPQVLVDLGDLKELSGITEQNGTVRLGALTRHRELLASPLVRERLPLLIEAASHIGHTAIRNRGTLGGSLAYADPAAELPACCVALDATIIVGSRAGTREVRAEDFFTGLFETGLRPGELILAVTFPPQPPRTAVAFAELARRHGDFALVGLAAVATPRDGRVDAPRFVYLGCSDRAKVAKTVGATVAGTLPETIDTAALAAALTRDLAPQDTPGLRADTRVQLATVLTRRVLTRLAAGAAR